MLDVIRRKYRSQHQSRVPSLRCRDSGPYFLPSRLERVPTANRQSLSICASRAPVLRAFLGGLSIIVTQPVSPVLGNHARNVSRDSPSTRAQSGDSYANSESRRALLDTASAAGHGRGRVGFTRDQNARIVSSRVRNVVLNVR